MSARHEDRRLDELRPVKIKRRFTRSSPGSVLIQSGRTTVLCTANISPEVPVWLAGQQRGWVTAEYNMLPGSTRPRRRRDRGGKIDGRSAEIQRLIGRSLRAVTDLVALGERTVTVDCDVLEADGGTRSLSITGAFVAMVDAMYKEFTARTVLPLRNSVAAVSVGIVNEHPKLDLDYGEDSAATVDMNVVMTGRGRFVEIQGCGEESTFNERQLQAMLKLARSGIETLTELQRSALGKRWPFD